MMKILVINTQSVNHNNATGITMRSFMQHIPCENIMEFYMQPCVAADDVIPIESEQMPLFACFARNIANRVLRANRVGKNAADLVDFKRNSKEGFKKMISRAIMLLDFEPVFLTPYMKKKIDKFKPDCIYTLGNAIDIMKMAVKINKKYKIPIVPHFMDNWPESHRYGEKYPGHRKSTQKWLKKLYEHSGCAIAISEKMAQQYEMRSGIKHYALMNSIDVSQFRCENDFSRSPRVFTYAGGLHLNRYRSLKVIAHTLEALNKKKHIQMQLCIYTDEKSEKLYRGEFNEFKCVKFNRAVRHEDIITIYKASDVLVHIETFDEEYKDFLRYSLSTKISEYLATGKTIILFAPEDIFIYEYLKVNRVAFVCADAKQLESVIESILECNTLQEMSSRAVSLANEKHNVSVCCEDFLSALNGATERGFCIDNE